MKIKALFFALVVFLSFPEAGLTQESVRKQAEFFRRNDIPEIAAYIKKQDISISKTMSKPTVFRLSSEQQALQNKKFVLLNILFEKVKEFEKTTQAKIDIDAISTIVDDYVTIGNAVSDGGGYVNYVMGDVLYSISLSRLAFFLLQNPTMYDEVERIWRKLKRPNFDISTLADMLEDEFGVTESRAELEQAESSGSLFLTFINLVRQRSDHDILEVTGVSRNISTSYLLGNKDHVFLAFRLANTNLVLEASIPGMIEFLRRGGEIDDFQLYRTDIREFLSLMGDSRKLFKARFYGETLLQLDSLLLLLEFEQDFKSSFFYQWALK